MVIVIAALMVIGVTQILSTVSAIQAEEGVWDSCSRGMVDCEYPGMCSSYIDTNNDNICDRSQLAPQQAILPEEHDTVENSVITNPVDTSSGDSGLGGDIPSTYTYVGEGARKGSHSSSYNLLPLLLITTITYLTTWALSKKKIISQKLHRKTWNIVLLISSIISAVLGLFLILNLEYNTGISLPFNMLFWHVEAGIVMGFIAMFHILWHWRYFVKILKMAA